VKVDNVRTRLSEKPEEISRGFGQVPAHVRLHGEAFLSQLLAKWPQRQDSIDPGIVPLLSLHAAHLRHQRLGPANLHRIYHVSDSHPG
jgi:hypothetical protein